MSNQPATFKQVDLRRAIKVAALEPGWRVRVTRTGDIILERSETGEATPPQPVEASGGIEL